MMPLLFDYVSSLGSFRKSTEESPIKSPLVFKTPAKPISFWHKRKRRNESALLQFFSSTRRFDEGIIEVNHRLFEGVRRFVKTSGVASSSSGGISKHNCRRNEKFKAGRKIELAAWNFVSKPHQPMTLLTRLKCAISRSEYF